MIGGFRWVGRWLVLGLLFIRVLVVYLRFRVRVFEFGEEVD